MYAFSKENRCKKNLHGLSGGPRRAYGLLVINHSSQKEVVWLFSTY